MEQKNHCGCARGQQLDDAPPCDIEAERAVLAVVLLEPRRITEVIAVLTPADFTDQSNRTIFEAMLQLQERGLPPDATLVTGELRDGGQYNVEVGISTATLADLFQLFPLVRHLPHYLGRVLEMSRRRHVIASRI